MTKLQFAFAERRSNERRALTGLMPGRLFVYDTDRTLSARPVDVSKTGLGILSSDTLAEGTRIGLAVDKEQTVILCVIWRKEDFGKRDLYRYGLESVDKTLDMEQIFLTTGCLK